MPRLKKYEQRIEEILPGYYDDIRDFWNIRREILYNPKTDNEREIKAALACLLYERCVTERNHTPLINYICGKLFYERSKMIQILFNHQREKNLFSKRVIIPEPKVTDELTLNDFYFNHILNSNLEQ